MRRLEFAIGCMGVASVLVGLLIAGQSASGAGATAPGETRQATVAPIPDEARRTPNPVPATAASIERGKLIFSSQCTMCHGVVGSGKGDLAASLGLTGLPDFTAPRDQQRRTDGEMFWVIKNGHGQMPKQGQRFDDYTWWSIVNYIRTLERKS